MQTDQKCSESHAKRDNKHRRQPQILQTAVKIDKLIPGGQALGTLPDGKKAMLWGALPGEQVTAIEVTKNKSSYLDGIVREFEQPSAMRCEPRDKEFLATSPWQIMDYKYELDTKRKLVAETFRQQKVSFQSTQVLPTITDGQDYHYRNKMEYSLYFDHADGQIHLAFHARGSHRKLPITSSSIERPEIYQAAQKIVDELNAKHEDARKFQSLLLRCNQSGQVSGGLYENGQKHPHFPELQDAIRGETYSYSPNGFFQINLPVYELALTEMKKWVKNQRVLDLYSGVGTIGLSVARDRELTLVECDKSAYRELEKNVHNMQTTLHASYPDQMSPQPVFAKSEEALEYIAPDQTVILDPPRAGCHAALIERLNETRPEQIIYLSCNPITQARDAALLQENYRIELIQPFNFFPRTPHIENLVVLTRK